MENITDKDMEQLERVAAINECRIEVVRFAREMERVLKENDHKGGWKNCPDEYLQARLVTEVGEFFNYVAYGENEGFDKKKELIDIANFCMMIWDNDN